MDRRAADRRRAARRTRHHGRPRRARHAAGPVAASTTSSRHDELDAAAKAVLADGIERLKDAQELLWASDTYAAARRVPGDGRRRQGLDDQARHVRRQPAGRAGRLVQAAVERGARPHVPVADRQGGSRAGTHRDLQPVPVRGGRRAAGPPRVARQAAAAGRRPWARDFWAGRYDDLNAFERHLDRNGTKIVKFFLHVSKAEQKRRFMARLDNPDKLWKFSAGDVAVRAPLGRVHAGLRGRDHGDVDRLGAVVRASPPTTST